MPRFPGRSAQFFDVALFVENDFHRLRDDRHIVERLSIRDQGFGNIEFRKRQGILEPDDARALFPVAVRGSTQRKLHGGAVARHNGGQAHGQRLRRGDAVRIGLFKVDLAVQALRCHIGAAEAADSAQALEGWEAQKKKEKGFTSPADAVEAVPHTLPALWRAEKIVSRSVKAGFNWDSAAGALDKLDEETAELRQAVEAGQPVDSPHGIREELGDALFILCKIAQMSGVDPEDALHRACDKYQGRFRRVADAADRPLNAYTEAEKIALWEQAKEN